MEEFTTEFAPGGVISLTSAEDRKKAWMPPTNNVNEGALGSYRVFIQKKPKTSMHMYNAIAQYSRNKTEAFMQQHFTEAEHAFLRHEAHLWDGSKAEKNRRNQLIEKQMDAVEKTREKA